ncbi:hypothetical protein LTR56_008541 [Elasticomyces elasticus]|nr:hypothetical protein LTR56_008541 [Elasticomyces elasticus]KAK4918226.1 hypothetical protein LTR49_013925 [Elasticomyces elasticus]
MLQTVANVVLPIICFRKIQITKMRRLNVMAWFGFPPLIPSGTGLVGFLVFLDASLCWNLIYPTIPCLRPTALSYATGGVKATMGSTSASRSHNLSNNERRTTGMFSQSKRLETDEVPLRPLDSRDDQHTSSVAASNEGDNHMQLTPPQTIRITQEYEVTRQ